MIVLGLCCVGLSVSILLLAVGGAVLMKRRFLLLEEDVSSGALILLASISWLVGISGSVLLPLDIALYDSDYYNENVMTITWKANYYVSLCLTWIACPLVVAYLNSDAFTTRSRIVNAIFGEFKYNAMLLVVVLVIVVVMIISLGVETIKTHIEPFLISFSNFYGLLLVVLCLGFGAIDFPVRFLVTCSSESDAETWIRREQKHVMESYTAYMSDSQSLRDVCDEIRDTVPSNTSEEERAEELNDIISILHDRVRLEISSLARSKYESALLKSSSQSSTRFENWNSHMSKQMKHNRLRELNGNLNRFKTQFLRSRSSWYHIVTMWERAKNFNKFSLGSVLMTFFASLTLVPLSFILLADEMTVVIPPDESLVSKFILSSSSTTVTLKLIVLLVLSFYTTTVTYCTFLSRDLLPKLFRGSSQIHSGNQTELTTLLNAGATICAIQFSLQFHICMCLQGNHGHLYKSSFRNLFNKSTSGLTSWFWAVAPIVSLCVACWRVYVLIRERFCSVVENDLSLHFTSSESTNMATARKLLDAESLRQKRQRDGAESPLRRQHHRRRRQRNKDDKIKKYDGAIRLDTPLILSSEEEEEEDVFVMSKDGSIHW